MRDILFRGKKVTDKEWVLGGYVNALQTDRETGFDKDTHFIMEHNGLANVVDPESVCQYTGLTDRNGKKIFEGDIMQSDDNKIGQVQWFEEHSSFMIWNNTENKVHFLYDNDFSKIEVIGNIFDNPELIGDQP